MGSYADFMEIPLEAKAFAYPSDPCRFKDRLKPFIGPSKRHENKVPRVFVHPAWLGNTPRAHQTRQNQKLESYKIRGPGVPGEKKLGTVYSLGAPGQFRDSFATVSGQFRDNFGTIFGQFCFEQF